jgi:hypothetical protein
MWQRISSASITSTRERSKGAAQAATSASSRRRGRRIMTVQTKVRTPASSLTTARSRRWIAVVGALALAALATVPAAAADRLTDKDVKALIERADHDRDRFEDQLDGRLKRSIVRSSGGEVNVEKYLDDLQENVKKLKERYSPQDAAGEKVAQAFGLSARQ